VLIKNGIAISMEGKDAGRDNIFVERLWRSIKNHIRGSLSEDFFSSLLVLLCHKFRCPFRAAQHGQRESVVARAATNLRRIVAIEFGTWRSGRNGGSSGLVTFA
jgi:hypothetical protein